MRSAKMHSTLSLPTLLDIIFRIVNHSDCPVEVLDDIPAGDTEVRALCLQIYELRQTMKALSNGRLDVRVDSCGCIAAYLRNIVEMLKGIEKAIKELARGEDELELSRLGELSIHFERISKTLQEERRLIEKYRNLSLTDMLTGLVNRRGFLALAEKSFALAQRKGQVLSFVMADIDRFKNVNDTYGHEIGDEILRGVAERLLEGLRMEDVCCRYGGEEFLVMLYDTDVSRAALVAERLRRMIAEKPFAVAGREIPITISLGVTDLSLEGNISPHDRETEIQRVIQRADALLYHAKKTGRNKVSAESPESFERSV